MKLLSDILYLQIYMLPHLYTQQPTITYFTSWYCLSNRFFRFAHRLDIIAKILSFSLPSKYAAGSCRIFYSQGIYQLCPFISFYYEAILWDLLQKSSIGTIYSLDIFEVICWLHNSHLSEIYWILRVYPFYNHRIHKYALLWLLLFPWCQILTDSENRLESHPALSSTFPRDFIVLLFWFFH